MFVSDLSKRSSDCYLSSVLEIWAAFYFCYVLHLIFRISLGPGRQDPGAQIGFWMFLAWHDISSSTAPLPRINRATDPVTGCYVLHTLSLRRVFGGRHCVLSPRNLMAWRGRVAITLTSWVMHASHVITINYIYMFKHPFLSMFHKLSGF